MPNDPSPPADGCDPPSYENAKNRRWPSELCEIFKAMWAENKLSASQMAAKLGISRCAVLGKAHRLKLASHFKAKQPKERKPIPTKRVRLPKVMGVLDDKPPARRAFLGLTLLELTANSCRFAQGDQAPFLFCGQEVQPGSAYCPHHHRLTHLPLSGSRPVVIPPPWNDYRPRGVA